MDLIYTNTSKEDVGVIKNYTLDLAYGSDENNFELSVQRDAYEDLGIGSILYMEGNDYGGIVDSINISSTDSTIIFSGRTFQGMLGSKIIEPITDYYEAYGEANAVIGELITYLNLGDLFKASTEDSGITITDYEFERYTDAYTGISKMLNDEFAKLKMKWDKDKVLVYAEMYIDYSQDEEFDTSVVEMSVTKDYHPTNHLICLGQGDMADRKVIHLFTDENGGIQPYADAEVPYKDSQYILDTSSQILTGIDEVVGVYDNSGAEITTNYVVLNSQPSNWRKKFSSYYYMDEDGEHKEVEVEEEDTYTLLSSKPSDWTKNYTNYYYKNGSSYDSVEGVSVDSYKKIKKKPKGWKSAYSSYYTRTNDGTQYIFNEISGVTKYKYKKQTMKPSDWASNYTSYYKKNKKGKLEKLSDKTAPKWKAKKFYTQFSYEVPPKWTTNCWSKVTTTSVPTWASNTYYSSSTTTIVPSFKANVYYQAYEDSYATLVEEGIATLVEAWSNDDVDVTLDASNEYDVGDMIGASQELSNIFVQKQIIKKIVKIASNGTIEISYEVGESI